MTDWKKIVGTVAPGIATALGGPLAGLAVQAMAGVLGCDPTPDACEKAILSASPTDLFKLKEAEMTFQVEMKRLDVDLERIASQDRESARNRQAQLKDHGPLILSIVITIGFFGVLIRILLSGMPAVGGEALLVLLGALGAGWTQVGNFYFGSSHGSATKTELLARSPALK